MQEIPQVSPELDKVFSSTAKLAAGMQHELILSEHLLYVLLEQKSVVSIFEHIDIDTDSMRDSVSRYLREKVEIVDSLTQPIQSIAFSRIINSAFSRVFASERDTVTVEDVLVAVVEEDSTYSSYILEAHGVDHFDLVKEVSNMDHVFSDEDDDDEDNDETSSYNFKAYSNFNKSEKNNEDDEDEPSVFSDDDDEAEADDSSENESEVGTKFLRRYAENMTELARQGKYDALVGRKTELTRIMQVLSRRKKNNPMLVGEPGVGKTAIVEGLAAAIARNDVPSKLKGFSVWNIDIGSIVAGTKFRGEFEERFKRVISEMGKLEKAIMFLDEAHSIVGAGSVSGSALDASNILKPALSSGTLRCVGTTTYEDYKNHILKDKAFSRRFQKIDVHESSAADTIKIINGLKSYYEDHYNVRYTKKAIEQAVYLSERHLSDRFLPDKAVDVIDEAGAKNDLKDQRKKKTITVRDIEEVISQMANIPQAKLTVSDTKLLGSLASQLENEVYGQSHAVESLVKSIKISKAGIGSKDKPIGSFLFCGPTGCGKTELAKQLANKLGINFVRFDMSEYAEKHTVSKLIGSPPGYVGFEQSGMLTEALIKTPHCVVLLDEIEKAHSDIYNILLQVMDYGTLTDNNGRKADFRNAVVIMTSNVGARELESNAIGFGGKQSSQTELISNRAVEKFFTPEFRNRLDGILHFNGLSEELMKLIVRKFIRELENDLANRKVKLSLSKKAVEHFAHSGFDPKMGARPLQRIIRSDLQEKLADEILFGGLINGGIAKVDYLKGEVVLLVE